MNRAAFVLVTFICLVWALVFASIHSPAHAASRNNDAFQREWAASKPDLKTSTIKPFEAAKPKAEKQKTSKVNKAAKQKQAADEKPAKRKRRGSSTPPELIEGDGSRRSQRDVCRSQCSLERMSCDQGRTAYNDAGATGFTNRSDQLRAVQSSCYLAVQGCLNRC